MDDHVKSIASTYDDLGRPLLVTSYENANGTGAIHNQIKYTYGNHGQVTKSEQSHQNAVTTGTPAVQYAYDASVQSGIYDDALRLETVTYPDGRVIFNGYGSTDTIFDRLGRLYRLWETDSGGNPTTILTEYSYNGTGRIVISDYQQPDVKLDLYGGLAGTYAGFDRFGRPIDHRWVDYSGTPFDVDRLKYGYDTAGNRTWREDTVAAAQTTPVHQDEFYTYDGLHRLKNSERGNLTGTFPNYTGITSKNFAQDWTLDQLGNWPTFKHDSDGNGFDFTQTRTHNEVNELETISNWANPAYDDAGNMTTMPQPLDPTDDYTAIYDAWNRLVELDGGVDAKYEYNGLHHLIVKQRWVFDDPFVNYYYYNDQWQVLVESAPAFGSERVEAIYAWHPYYIDALAMSFRPENRHVFLHDANFNVTAAYDVNPSSGTYRQVVERYRYTPYGEVTVLDANFALDADGKSDIGNNYLYTGRERDPWTGFYNFRTRPYHPGLGRFTGRDWIEYEDGYSFYAAYFVPNDLDPFGTKKKRIRDVLADLCDSCCATDAQKRACKFTARQIGRSLSNAWKDTAKNPGRNRSRDQVHGYLCWDWADQYERTCDKYGGKYWEAEHRSIIRKKRGTYGTPVHNYTRFCACGSDEKECCIDLDDGWFHGGVYYHDPG